MRQRSNPRILLRCELEHGEADRQTPRETYTSVCVSVCENRQQHDVTDTSYQKLKKRVSPKALVHVVSEI